MLLRLGLRTEPHWRSPDRLAAFGGNFFGGRRIIIYRKQGGKEREAMEGEGMGVGSKR